MNTDSILAVGVFIFLVSICVHILIWRRKRPHRDVLALLLIFVFAPALLIFSIPFLPAEFSVLTLEEACAAYVLNFGLAGSYIGSYPSFQAFSPSLKILHLFRNEPEGLTRDQIFRAFDPRTIVSERVQDLVDSKLIKKGGEGFVLTLRARAITSLYAFYRKSIGMSVKGA